MRKAFSKWDVPPLNNGGEIKIKKGNEGKFTAKANAAGMGVQEYASKVLAAKEGTYDPSTRRQANFARNAKSWNNEGGPIPDLNDPSNRDTVPAMLTEGEFVLNKEATNLFRPHIEAMNKAGLRQRHAENQAIMRNMGGPLSMQYLQDGGEAGEWVTDKVGLGQPYRYRVLPNGMIEIEKNPEGRWYGGKQATFVYNPHTKQIVTDPRILSEGLGENHPLVDSAMRGVLAGAGKMFQWDPIVRDLQSERPEVIKEAITTMTGEKLTETAATPPEITPDMAKYLVDTGETLGTGRSKGKLLYNPIDNTYYRQRHNGEIKPIPGSAQYGQLKRAIDRFEKKEGVDADFTRQKMYDDVEVKDAFDPNLISNLQEQGFNDMEIQRILEEKFGEQYGNQNWATPEADAEMQSLIEGIKQPTVEVPPIQDFQTPPPVPADFDEETIDVAPQMPDVTVDTAAPVYEDDEEAIMVAPSVPDMTMGRTAPVFEDDEEAISVVPEIRDAAMGATVPVYEDDEETINVAPQMRDVAMGSAVPVYEDDEEAISVVPQIRDAAMGAVIPTYDDDEETINVVPQIRDATMGQQVPVYDDAEEAISIVPKPRPTHTQEGAVYGDIQAQPGAGPEDITYTTEGRQHSTDEERNLAGVDVSYPTVKTKSGVMKDKGGRPVHAGSKFVPRHLRKGTFVPNYPKGTPIYNQWTGEFWFNGE